MIDALEPCPDCGSLKHKSCRGAAPAVPTIMQALRERARQYGEPAPAVDAPKAILCECGHRAIDHKLSSITKKRVCIFAFGHEYCHCEAWTPVSQLQNRVDVLEESTTAMGEAYVDQMQRKDAEVSQLREEVGIWRNRYEIMVHQRDKLQDAVLLAEPEFVALQSVVERLKDNNRYYSELHRKQYELMKADLAAMQDDRDAYKSAGDHEYVELVKTHAELVALRASQDGIELRYRRLMWLSHGHAGLYGDDGEMQCGQCKPTWDYRNDPLEEVEEQYKEARRAAIVRAEQREALVREYKTHTAGLRAKCSICVDLRRRADELIGPPEKK